MRNFNRVALLLLSGSLLFSCKNAPKEVELPVNEGTAYAGLTLTQAKSGLRAISDSQADENGLTEEQGLATIDLLSNKKAQSWTSGTTDQAGKFWKVSGSEEFYTVAPWKTDPGAQKMALLVNKGTDMDATISGAADFIFGAAGKEKANLTALTTDNKFVMSSAVADKDVKPSITEAEVKGVSTREDLNKNVFAFEVERVVAKGLVFKGADMVKKATGEDGAKMVESNDGKGSVNISTLQYAAINGAVKTYLFGSHAGDRKMTDKTDDANDQKYKGYASAIDDAHLTFQNAKEAETVKNELIRLGNIDESSNDNLGGYKAINVFDDETKAKAAKAIYFMENSVKELGDAVNKDYGFYRLAYAKIYATYVPKEVLKWNKEKQMFEKDLTYKAGQTFYRGTDDNLFYSDWAALKKHTSNKHMDTYTNGKCFYRALWNRQYTEANKVITVTNANTRRNNIYLLQVDGFETIGAPWDPSDPKDPNNPKPTPPKPKPDPDGESETPIEPTPENPTPENPDIEKQETYMRVTAKILPWNLVTRKVVLD